MSNFRISFTIRDKDLGAILELISGTATDLSVNEIKSTTTPNHLYRNPKSPMNSGIWGLITKDWQINQVMAIAQIREIIATNSQYSPDSASATISLAVKNGFAERVGCGAYRRIK